jgi:hypothetical protein
MWVELAKIPVQIIRETVERLVAQCKEIVEAEKETLQGEEYVNESDPSVLRFLLASREEVPGLLFFVVFFYRSFSFLIKRYHIPSHIVVKIPCC